MRTLLAVVVGFVVWSVLWVGGNALLAGAMPDRFAEDGSTREPGVLALILVLSVVYSVFAGFLTARIAQATSSAPATVLGGVLLAVGIAIQVSYWSLMPVWYHLIFLGLLVPMTIIGGRLGGRRTRQASAR